MASIVTRYPRRNRAFIPRPSISRAFQEARQRAQRWMTLQRSRTMMQQRRRARSVGGVTTQHDSRLIYRKRNMPRRRRRRWKSFVRKVNAVSDKDLGSRTVVLNKSIQFSNTTSGNQVYGAIYLYSQSNAGTTYCNDLAQVCAMENSGNPTAAGGITVEGNTKILFQSAVLDVTFKNNSTYTDTGPTVRAASEAKLEVDVYECICRVSTEESGSVFGNFESLLADNTSRTKTIGGAGTIVSLDKRGVTPWDLNYSLSRWGIKILKKTKYVVPNQDTFTYQVRDPKRRTATVRDLTYKDGFNRPGWTRIIYITAKLVPDLTVGAGIGTYQENLIVGATRKYFYKIEGANDDRSRYLANT